MKPKLRWPIDLRIQSVEGQEVLILNCPVGITPQPLVLIAAVAPLVAQFQGELTIDEIAGLFAEHGISSEIVAELAQLLDQHFFLESPAFFEAEKKVKNDFALADLRQTSLAGLSYSADPGLLELAIDEHLSHGDIIIDPGKGALSCLVAPHIDYKRGGSCYGKTYSALREQEHDLYILIGTSHQYSDLLFHLTAKDFASPLGTLACDKDFMQRLAARYGTERSFKDELLHRQEHSLELQTPFLKRIKTAPKIAPILVGSFFSLLDSGKSPESFEPYDKFAAALTETIAEEQSSGKSVCVVAGVDMAHVGREFGDEGALNLEKMQEIARRDQIYIDSIIEQDKEKLFSHIAEDMDARRICGFPTMYTVLDTFDRLKLKLNAELIDYQQAVNYETDCAVTFAGIGLYEPKIVTNE